MNGFLNKNLKSYAKNWLAPVKYAEMQSKNAVRNQYTNLYAYGANNPVHYIDPDGRSPFAFIKRTEEEYTEINSKYKTTQHTIIRSTFRIYSGNQNTLQGFKNWCNFMEGEIYECDSDEIPDALCEYLDLFNDDNILIVTCEKETKIKYYDSYDEYKTSEKERVILIYEKKGDEYVISEEIYNSEN